MYLKGQSLRLPGAELFRLGSPLQPVFDRETPVGAAVLSRQIGGGISR
jgi:hypothetical protein